MDLYVPEGSKNLKDVKTQSPIRLGLQGPPGTGKTWAALTFPNAFVADWDNKLVAHNGKDVPNAPFWSKEWIEQFYTKAGRKIPSGVLPMHNIYEFWLSEELHKFKPHQTFIHDSWTFFMNRLDSWLDENHPVDRQGNEDTFKYWGLKLSIAKKIMALIESAPCNVIVTFHETPERDKLGRITGKLKPLMTGQFADQLQGHFTDFFRQKAVAVLEDPKDSTSKPIKTNYVWQIKSDNICDCSCSIPSIPEELFEVPANYSFFADRMQKR